MAEKGDSSTEVQFSLSLLISEASYSDLRKLEIITMRVLSYIRRLSGNESINAAIAQIQKIMVWLRTMQMMLHSIQVAQSAVTGGPLGWAMAAMNIVAFAFTTQDTFNYDIYRSTA
jgi:hypothetical protein